MNEDILLVKIHNALAKGVEHYAATKGNWKLDKRRLTHIQYVAGVNNGKIVCVFTPSSWTTIKSDIKKENNRKCFEGTEADSQILSKLRNNEALLLGKFGSGASIAYAAFSELN